MSHSRHGKSQCRHGLSRLGQSINKDHQRMMVDPMFMIVKNVRSFLMAITPTAVTPTAVILLEFT